jgi:hypothetical protein
MTKCIQCNAPSNITFKGTDYCWTHYDDASGKTANSNISSNNGITVWDHLNYNAIYSIDQDKLYCEKYLNNLEENGLIYDVRYDDKEQTFYCMLINPIEYIKLNFIVTPTGVIYKKDEIL